MTYCPRRWCVGRIMVHPHPNHWKLGVGLYVEERTLWVCLRILRWGDYPESSKWPPCNHKGNRKTGESEEI